MKTLSVLLAATIAHVFEFCPAPGQFTNVLPEYSPGDDAAAMCLKAENCLKNANQEMISLGGWGGYIVFGFDHEIINLPGEYDLKILGNAFYAASSSDSRLGGSSEPGVVFVSRDENANGLPDDPWYELVGSEYHSPLTSHHYSLTYYRTDPGHIATPDSAYPYLTDTTYIMWKDGDGKTGYLSKNSFHQQDYFPEWLGGSVTFTGTLLPSNSVDQSQVGSSYVSYCFDWGYVDNLPNEDKSRPQLHASEFMLDWAVDSAGNFVSLPGIHFVKVCTGTLQNNGWLGESSTELLDAWDMHPQAKSTDKVVATFENRPTGIWLNTPDSFWCGTSPLTSGVNAWTSGSYGFYSYNDNAYGTSYYYAFAVSNDTSRTSAGYWEPYRSAAGGAYEGSNFAVWSSDYYSTNAITCVGDTVSGFWVCNNAYTVHEMTYGGYAKAFDAADYLTLLCVGYLDGVVTDTIQVDLASAGTYIGAWTWVDVSALGKVDAIVFSMVGSDTGSFGLNTPAYVCVDNFGQSCPIGYTEPARVAFPLASVLSPNGISSLPEKCLMNGQLLIWREGQRYDVLGRIR